MCLNCKKTLTLLSGLIFLCQITIAQKIEPHHENSLDPKELSRLYTELSKKQKTVGWATLGGGIGLFFLGAAIGNSEGDETMASILRTTALLSTTAGISFLITAGSNKKKAALVLKNEKLSHMSLPGIRYSIPSAGIRFNIGSQ